MGLLKIGVVVNTHGLKGTVKVKSFTDFLEQRYKKGNTLYILFKGEHLPVTVVKYKTLKGVELIDFAEITHINDAEKYKTCDLFIDEESINHDLPEDEFYFRDLIGMEVHTDQLIGTVSDIREYPQGEYLIVSRTGEKDAIIPYIKQFIKEVDKAAGKIFIIEMEGLLWGLMF